MKQMLSVEQSAELIKRGVSADKASMVCMDFNGTYAYVCGEESHTVRDCVNGQFYVEESRVFTLADLLSLLPKEVIADTRFCKNETCPINIRWDYTMGIWFVVYELVSLPDGIGEDSELINALFSTLLWAIDHNHVKLD